MRKRIRFRKANHYSAVHNAVGLAVRFRFTPQAAPYQVILLVRSFTDMALNLGFGITGGTAAGKAWYFLGLPPHAPVSDAHQTWEEVSEWLMAVPDITDVRVGPVGQTLYEAFGPHRFTRT